MFQRQNVSLGLSYSDIHGPIFTSFERQKCSVDRKVGYKLFKLLVLMLMVYIT